MVHLKIRNESMRRRLYRRDVLLRLAEKICAGEGAKEAVELSVLFCDDPFIAELNRQYRHKACATDVLSFAQTGERFHGVRVLGDIVISLETVERFCKGDRAAMRRELRLLFCHGLLHLLGMEHGNAASMQRMKEKQAEYLGETPEGVWHDAHSSACRH